MRKHNMWYLQHKANKHLYSAYPITVTNFVEIQKCLTLKYTFLNCSLIKYHLFYLSCIKFYWRECFIGTLYPNEIDFPNSKLEGRANFQNFAPIQNILPKQYYKFWPSMFQLLSKVTVTLPWFPYGMIQLVRVQPGKHKTLDYHQTNIGSETRDYKKLLTCKHVPTSRTSSKIIQSHWNDISEYWNNLISPNVELNLLIFDTGLRAQVLEDLENRKAYTGLLNKSAFISKTDSRTAKKSSIGIDHSFMGL